MSDSCQFCAYSIAKPHLMIYDGPRWSVMHVAARWPAGSIYIVPKRHALLHEVPLDEWAEGGRMLPGLSKMLLEHAGAERTYLLAFSELFPHLHLIMVAKRAEHSRDRDGKHGISLLNTMLGEGALADEREVTTIVAKYRAVVHTHLGQA